MRIERLPFYWRLKEKGSPNIVPDYRPFEFDFIESLQLIIQKREDLTLQYLEEIYKAEYNIGYLQDINEIAKPYGKDFMDFIEGVLNSWGKNVSNILEVGCGGCTILSELKSKGYKVIGVDPSPIAVLDGVKKGIRVINEFFPTKKFIDEVDLIFHSDVQEHVSDPVKFLSDQRKQLSEDGLIIISLPDANEGIERGEISMAMHQHLNYFDNESLRNTVEAAGLKVLTIETAKYGGSLYCCAQNNSQSMYENKKGRKKYDEFALRIEKNLDKVGSELTAVLADKSRKTGFYVPLRTLPYMAAINKYEGFRFFDDTNHWYNHAFDGMEVYIENFEDLKKNPVTDLYVMSLTFGDTIKQKIENSISGINRITTLREMLI